MKKYANQQLIVKRGLFFYTDVSNRKRDIYRVKKYMTRESEFFSNQILQGVPHGNAQI